MKRAWKVASEFGNFLVVLVEDIVGGVVSLLGWLVEVICRLLAVLFWGSVSFFAYIVKSVIVNGIYALAATALIYFVVVVLFSQTMDFVETWKWSTYFLIGLDLLKDGFIWLRDNSF